MKGYPKFKAEIIDRSQIQDIQTTILSGPVTVIMQPYTSDKGTEKWEMMRGFSGFTDVKGPISFARHGQEQLTVTEVLRAGGVILGKRMVSEDAMLANITVRARVVKVDDVAYLYTYVTSDDRTKRFKEAYTEAHEGFDPENLPEVDGAVDIPLFTVTPMGRGVSNLSFRINPEYLTNRSADNFVSYSFEVYEGTRMLESILFTMNPDIIVDNVSQSMNVKIKTKSKQVQARFFEDGVMALVEVLGANALHWNGTDALPLNELVNQDFIFGRSANGKYPIGNILTIADAADDASDLWSQSIPNDIKDKIVDLSDANCIRLPNGTYGTITSDPMSNREEYNKMLIAAFGGDTSIDFLFDPIIYDLDAYKVDAIFDCNWSKDVKKQIINVADFRGDLMFFMDLGKEFIDTASMIDYLWDIPHTRYMSIYHNFFNVYDPYTRREITVTMPYLLAIRMVGHLNSGVNRPFAGMANNMIFPEIIDDTINFLPYDIPGTNQKQILVDANINYLNYYDGMPVMDTMYTNNHEHSQLSYLSNVMGIQEIIKRLRHECPKSRYTFVDGEDLEKYLDDIKAIINEYKSQYNTLDVEYMADEKYELNKIFYATLTVRFKKFFQEEYFKIIAIN